MRKEDLLSLRNVILATSDTDIAKEVANYLWTNLRNNPWTKEELFYLEKRTVEYLFKGTKLAFYINPEGKLLSWNSLQHMIIRYPNRDIIHLDVGLERENMEKRNLTVSLEQAKAWYRGDNTTLRELALQIFAKEDLVATYYNILSNTEVTPVYSTCPIEYTAKIAAQCKLAIIAKYFNGDWEMEVGVIGYYIYKSECSSTYEIGLKRSTMTGGTIYFKNEKDAEKAIELMGEDIKHLF